MNLIDIVSENVANKTVYRDLLIHPSKLVIRVNRWHPSGILGVGFFNVEMNKFKIWDQYGYMLYIWEIDSK